MLSLCYRNGYEAGVTGIRPEMECRAKMRTVASKPHDCNDAAVLPRTLRRPAHFAVESAWLAVSDPSGALFASTATWSPEVKSFVAILNSVTGVLGGTVTF
jgi:hypothetical protein